MLGNRDDSAGDPRATMLGNRDDSEPRSHHAGEQR